MQDRTGQVRIGQDRTDRKGQDRTGQRLKIRIEDYQMMTESIKYTEVKKKST